MQLPENGVAFVLLLWILFENTLWYTEQNFKKAGHADYNNYTNTFSLQSFHKVDLLHLKNA